MHESWLNEKASCGRPKAHCSTFMGGMQMGWLLLLRSIPTTDLHNIGLETDQTICRNIQFSLNRM